MILFTPNTVIKSADVNTNFNELTSADTTLQGRATNLETLPYYNGDIGAETAAGYKTIGTGREYNSGITKTNTTTLTVVTKGVYYIHIQQLINTVNAGYFEIRVNNNTAVYGYYTGNSMNDVPAHTITPLNVGDTIRVYQSHAITTSWAGSHSDISIMCLRRT